MKKQSCPTCGSTQIPYKKINKYCWKHIPDTKRCTDITRAGIRCSSPAFPGTYKCKVHRSKRKKTREPSQGLPGGRGPGYVYIVDLGRDDYYKIGTTVNFTKRLSALRSSNPWVEEVVCRQVYNAALVEKELHRKYQHQNLEREIFKLSKTDIETAINFMKDHEWQDTTPKR